MSEEIKKIQSKITPILKKHQVKRSSIFGSFARGENKKNSDIDLLIEFKGRKSLFDMAGLKIDLEKKLNKKVDLLTYKAVHPYLKDRVSKDAVKIYG